MPHVLFWLLVLSGPAGPLQVVIQSEPFPTREACEAWDRVPLSIRANAQVVSSESVCVPLERLGPRRDT
ncbi:MAG: hypothetical protein KA200_00425 [Burkholderiales bacterium]|nr:hypothetical protein [Burkholderiales bacterium]